MRVTAHWVLADPNDKKLVQDINNALADNIDGAHLSFEIDYGGDL